MGLLHKKIDNGEFWLYEEKLKLWQLYTIPAGLFVIALLLGTYVSKLASGVFVFLLLLFFFVNAIDSLPSGIAYRKALKMAKKIIIQKKDGHRQMLIEK